MARQRRAAKGPVTLWDKVNKFDPNFAAEVQTMTDEALRAKLIQLANDDQKIEDAREKDGDLETLQNQLTTAKQTYSVPLKENRMKKKLIIDYLRSRGQLTTE